MLAPWPKQNRKSLPTNVQRVFQGVNRLDGFTIGENYSTDIKNMTTANYPVLSVRPGFSLVGTARAARILGLGAHKQTELQAIANGEWWSLVSGTWTSRKTGLSASANWSYANFKGGFSDIYLIGANGVDAVQVYNGSTVANLTNAPTAGKFIETYADRLWCVTDGNQLNFSEYRVGTNWTTTIGADSDPGFITVETNDGETISGTVAGPKRLVIFKPNSMFNLFGDYSESFTLNKISDVGALSDQAITTINGIIYFVHQTGVYEYSGGTRPDRDFAQPVRDYIDRINPAAASKVSCGTDGKMLYIGIPLDSATEPDTILEFNTEYRTWSAWKDYAPLNFVQLSRDAYVGGVEGQIRKIGGSTSDNGIAISWYATSKPMTAQSMAQRIMMKRAWMTSNIPLNSTMQVSLSKSAIGESDFTMVQNIPAQTVITGTRVIIPTTTAAHANYIRYKLSGTGPADIIELAWESDSLPIY